MLGIREPEVYGKKDYKYLLSIVRKRAKELGVTVKLFQSNFEGEIVTEIQKAHKKYDGIIINPAAYTHTSIAILDALKAVGIKTAEVHISDVDEREDFRKTSFVSLYAEKVIKGKGIAGYVEALDYLAGR